MDPQRKKKSGIKKKVVGRLNKERMRQRPPEVVGGSGQAKTLSKATAEPSEEERWSEDKAVLRRAATDAAQRLAEGRALARPGREDAFQLIAKGLEDESSAEAPHEVVAALYNLNPDRAASFFNIALREGPPERRRRIGAALAASSLMKETINNLSGESHKNTYAAFSLLFLVAKAGEVQPLMRVIECHPSVELRLAIIRLLSWSGEPDIVPAFQHLAAGSSLPPEVYTALMEAIDQIRSQITAAAPSAA